MARQVESPSTSGMLHLRMVTRWRASHFQAALSPLESAAQFEGEVRPNFFSCIRILCGPCLVVAKAEPAIQSCRYLSARFLQEARVTEIVSASIPRVAG